MRLIIEAPLFASAQLQRDPFALPTLWQLCLDRTCHYISVDPPDAVEFREWLNGLPAQGRERERIEFLLEEGVQRQARDASTTVIRIADVPDVDWSGKVPRFSLGTANALLREPLSVVIEGVHDETFLKASVPFIYRERFETWSRSRCFKLEHRGGIQNLRHVLAKENLTPELCLRLFVMLDSDARKRGEPSSDSRRLANTCAHHGLPHHQLERRAIENYIPEPALKHWLGQQHARDFDEKWLAKLHAFRSLSEEQRHHYNMKHGLKKDRKSAEGVADIFEPLIAQQPDKAALLEEGFSSIVARAFHERIEENAFTEDGQRPELMRLFETMLRAA
ncbi:hypothetical protein [Archangium primigenium]|uniref:hypothetical protein n=1 Tax=[Archangium] primigenium TaxID=2792470 RepID=UPI00195BA2B1|nr:hypothetical protein [Archangium primigenium]MBM7112525.1 hypothetical protein [Archangium primigenium]